MKEALLQLFFPLLTRFCPQNISPPYIFTHPYISDISVLSPIVTTGHSSLEVLSLISNYIFI
jgi:hypothetical protein